MKLTPQEIEVWYILPQIRKELAQIMITDFNLTQKKVAKLLGITEPAVSQYIKGKRAKGVKFTKKIKEMIKKSAKAIIETPAKLMEEMQKICFLIRKEHVLCDLHRKHDQQLQKKCHVCLSSEQKLRCGY